MTSGIIDESAIAEALRLGEPGEAIKRLLRFQGLGVWHGNLSEMRGDVPPTPSSAEPPAAPSAEANEVRRRMKMERHLRDAIDRLSHEHREALSLRYYKSLPIEEIAGKLGLTASSAEDLVREALNRVEAMYAETVNGRDEL